MWVWERERELECGSILGVDRVGHAFCSKYGIVQIANV